MADGTPAEIRSGIEVPLPVLRHVSDCVTPGELGASGSPSSELIHRVMLETFRATKRFYENEEN